MIIELRDWHADTYFLARVGRGRNREIKQDKIKNIRQRNEREKVRERERERETKDAIQINNFEN